MPVDQTKVWDTRSHAVQPGGEEDSSGQNDSIHKVCLCFFTFLNTPVINCTSMQSCCRGSLGVRGAVILSHKVKQQHHHLFTGLRSFSRGSGLQRNDSVWKAANRSSRRSRPSSTCPVRAEWRAWSWGCLTGKQCHYLLPYYIHIKTGQALFLKLLSWRVFRRTNE